MISEIALRQMQANYQYLMHIYEAGIVKFVGIINNLGDEHIHHAAWKRLYEAYDLQ